MGRSIVQWIIAMAVAIGTTAVAISAIDRAVEHYNYPWRPVISSSTALPYGEIP